jgi:hypothetical protein
LVARPFWSNEIPVETTRAWFNLMQAHPRPRWLTETEEIWRSGITWLSVPELQHAHLQKIVIDVYMMDDEIEQFTLVLRNPWVLATPLDWSQYKTDDEFAFWLTRHRKQGTGSKRRRGTKSKGGTLAKWKRYRCSLPVSQRDKRLHIRYGQYRCSLRHILLPIADLQAFPIDACEISLWPNGFDWSIFRFNENNLC